MRWKKVSCQGEKHHSFDFRLGWVAGAKKLLITFLEFHHIYRPLPMSYNRISRVKDLYEHISWERIRCPWILSQKSHWPHSQWNYLWISLYMGFFQHQLLMVHISRWYALPFSWKCDKLLEFVSFLNGCNSDLKFSLEYDTMHVHPWHVDWVKEW